MARIRSVKPEYFTSETVAKLSWGCRAFFIGFWTHVDDDGRCKDAPAVLKGALAPNDDDVTAATIDGWMAELASAGLVVRYEVAGKRYACVNPASWAEHQKISHPAQSRLPAPSDLRQEDSGDPPEDSGATPETLRPDLGSRNRDLGGETAPEDSGPVLALVPPAKPSRKKPAVPFPADFVLTDSMRDAAAERGMARCVMDHEFRSFRDHALANGKSYSDWPAAWRTWAGNHVKFNRRSAAPDGEVTYR